MINIEREKILMTLESIAYDAGREDKVRLEALRMLGQAHKLFTDSSGNGQTLQILIANMREGADAAKLVG